MRCTTRHSFMSHFSRFIRPGAIVIGVQSTDEDLMVTAAQNSDGSVAVTIFNEGLASKIFKLQGINFEKNIKISPQAIQTILITN